MKTGKLGFLQAFGVAAYCSLIGIVLWQGPNVFPKVNSYFGPVMFLLLFSTSALVCGLMVFYKPYQLFFAGKKKEAIGVVVSTSLWLFLFLFIFFLLMII
jgi:hypothetical protein